MTNHPKILVDTDFIDCEFSVVLSANAIPLLMDRGDGGRSRLAEQAIASLYHSSNPVPIAHQPILEGHNANSPLNY
ncbi:MAG: hypothetical protein AB4042_19490 [Leptolyngbyaceae cyanobacterium]